MADPISAPRSAPAPFTQSGELRADLARAVNEDARMRRVAQEFEQVFMTEMVKAARIGEARGAFTGGVGEQAFVSLLQREYATAMTESESFGLAEHVYSQLRQRAQENAE